MLFMLLNKLLLRLLMVFWQAFIERRFPLLLEQLQFPQ
jgi:hypothetical protein